MQRIIIIGAGLIGAALAYRLTEAGAAVTVIEAAQPASGASGASFGWINASFFHSAAHFNLRQAGIAAHHRLSEQVGQTGTHWPGTLWWEEEAELDKMAASLTDLGYAVQILARAEIQAREPLLAAPERCLWFADEGAADPAELTRRLLAASGARVWTGTAVRGIEVTGGRVVGVRLDQGVIVADHVVVAAGVACAALMAPLGLTLPMLHRPGMILRTRPVGARVGHILASPAQEVRQDLAGRLIAPLAASHQGDAGHAVDLPGDLAEAALLRIRALLPGVAMELAEVAAAFRPVPGDGLPAVGATGIAGLSLAVLHSGVTLAGIVAELLTAEIMSGDVSPMLAEFRPDRFF